MEIDSERGISLMLLAMTLGGAMAAVAVSVVAMNLAVSRQASGISNEVEASADQLGRLFMGTALLAQRLQSPDPLHPAELDGVSVGSIFPGVAMEDEGGKVSLPVNSYALPEILMAYGVDRAREKALEIAEWWEASVVDVPGGKYPVLWPSTAVKAIYRFECAEELGAALELPTSQMREVRKWFTPCEVVGVNVNTSDERCLAGLLEWQKSGAITWTDRMAKGELSSPAGNQTFYVYPVPGPDPTWPKLIRPSILDLRLPVGTLFPTDPSEGYNPLWQTVQVAMASSFTPDWLDPPKFKKAKFSDRPVDYPRDYSYDSYAVRSNAWFRFAAADSVADIMAGRPYRTEEVTQPLGLLWITPESWCLPMTPAFMGDLHDSQSPAVPPYILNTALSSAAFTGWISLQGPGPYTTASEWYTLGTSSSAGGVRMSRRLTVQVWPDEMPRILLSDFEVE